VAVVPGSVAAKITARGKEPELKPPSRIVEARYLRCPLCRMGMLLIDGYGLDSKRQTFECLRCELVEKLKGKTHRDAA
jgi:hypothetical protein